jgi:hypothetical protein
VLRKRLIKRRTTHSMKEKNGVGVEKCIEKPIKWELNYPLDTKNLRDWPYESSTYSPK